MSVWSHHNIYQKTKFSFRDYKDLRSTPYITFWLFLIKSPSLGFWHYLHEPLSFHTVSRSGAKKWWRTRGSCSEENVARLWNFRKTYIATSSFFVWQISSKFHLSRPSKKISGSLPVPRFTLAGLDVAVAEETAARVVCAHPGTRR